MFFKYNIFSFLWALIIFGLSILPGEDLPEFSFWELLTLDKVAHFICYAILVYLLCIAFFKQYTYTWLRYNPVRGGLIAAILYGIIIEGVQGAFLPDRYFEIMDVAANTLGSIAGSLYFRFIIYKII